jgi:hypothetical protein
MDLVLREYGPAFNIIHVSAAITHLAQLSSCSSSSSISSGSDQQQQHQQQQSEQDNMQQVIGIQLVAEQMNRQHQQLEMQLGQQQQHQQHRAAASFRGQQQQQLQLVHQLLEGAVPLLQEAGSRQVANMLWALAQLHFPWQATPSAAAATMALVDRAAELFSNAEGQHLSNIVYAAAKLQLPVSCAWLAGLQQAWLQHVLPAQQQQQQQLSLPGSSSSIGTSQRRQAPSAGAPVSPQAAANMVWALTHLQQQQQQQSVSTSWLDQMVCSMAGNLTEWPARSVAVLLWGCAKLGYTVRAQTSPVALQQHKQQQQQKQQKQKPCVDSRLDAEQFSREEQQVASRAEQQQQQQQQDVPVLLLQAMQAHSQSFSSQDVSQVLWAAAEMRLQLPAPLLQQLLAAGGARLQHEAQGDCATAQSVSLMLHSLVKLGVVPQQQLPPHLLRPWLAALLASCAAADSHCLASAAWALGTLGLAGSCPLLLKALMQAATQHLQEQQQTLALQLQPKPPAAAAEAAGSSSAVSSRAVASLLWAAAHCAPAAPAAEVASAWPARQHGRRAGQQLQLSRVHQQQYLKQRQQRRLMLMLHGMQHAQHSSNAVQQGSATAAPAASRPDTPATAVDTSGKGIPAHGAIHSAAVQLLVAAADLPPQTQHQGSGEQLQLDMQQQQQQGGVVLPGASLLDLSQVLWAVSKLQLQLPESWWQACLLQLQQLALQARRQHRATAQQHLAPASLQQQQQQQQLAQSLAVATWAAGRVCASRLTQLRMQRQLIRELAQTSQPYLQQQQQQQPSSLCGQGHVMLLVGLVRLCAASGHQLRSRDYQRGSSSSSRHFKWRRRFREHRRGVVWVRDAGLDPAWLQAFCSSAAPHLHTLPPTGVVALLWGLAKLRYHPGSSFVAGALQRVQQQQAQMSARHVALLLWSLVRLQHVPDEPLLGVLLEAWEARLASASKADRQQVQYVQQQLQQLQCMQQDFQARNSQEQQQQWETCREGSVAATVQQRAEIDS